MKTYLINEGVSRTSVFKADVITTSSITTAPLKTDSLIKLIHLFVILSILAFSASAIASNFSQSDIKQLLIEEAYYQDISPSLVLAIAKVESDFNPSALSHAGAKGVMQIMPATAKNVFQVEGHELYNAKVNIRIGVAFIKQLIETYDGRVDIALSHYNGGSRVKRPNGALRVIPATSKYVNKVQMHAQRYKSEGYDKAIDLAERGTLAKQSKNQRLTLSYAQQMALDELDYDDMAKQSVASFMQQQAEKPNPRINQLQDLRVHNLTRSLPSKTLKAEKKTSTTALFDSTEYNMLEPSIVATSQSFIRGPKQSYTSYANNQVVHAKVQVSAMPKYNEPPAEYAYVEYSNNKLSNNQQAYAKNTYSDDSFKDNSYKAPPRNNLIHKEQAPIASSYQGSSYQASSYQGSSYQASSSNKPGGNKQQRVSSWEAIFD